MTRRGCLVWIGIAVFSVVGTAQGQPVIVDIDPTISEITFELCVMGECDSDSSRVDGTITVELDSYTVPTQIRLHDFDMQMLDDMSMYISVLFGLGTLSVDLYNIRAYYAEPGNPMAYVPLSGGDFTFTDVPTDLEGTLVYDAGGVICTALQGAGMPCQDTIDLQEYSPVNAAEITGNASIDGETLTLLFEPDATIPLDPSNPDLGDVTFSGSVTGYGAIPGCPVPPERIRGLMAEKSGASGVRLTWIEEPTAVGGYRVYSVTNASLEPRGDTIGAHLECETTDPTDTSCTDADGAISSDWILFYEVVGVCGDGSEGDN